VLLRGVDGDGVGLTLVLTALALESYLQLFYLLAKVIDYVLILTDVDGH
jgi:hypothetical protein